jgi:hypothetical protein
MDPADRPTAAEVSEQLKELPRRAMLLAPKTAFPKDVNFTSVDDAISPRYDSSSPIYRPPPPLPPRYHHSQPSLAAVVSAPRPPSNAAEFAAAGSALSTMSIVDAMLTDASWTSAEYYDNLEFASQLCSTFAAEESKNGVVLSENLVRAEATLKQILASNFVFPQSINRERISSAMSQAIATANDANFRDENARLALPKFINRAKAFIAREPAWPLHGALIRFEAALLRLTSHYFFSKKWVPRAFVLRGSRLYYSNGKNGHADSLEGSLELMRSNPAPDEHCCMDLTGVHPYEVWLSSVFSCL